MQLPKIKEYIENQFVDDYEEISQFMNNVNNTLSKMNIDKKYESYNKFCLDIERFILNILENDTNIETITISMIASALNDMIKYKILEDNNYEDKIRNYFEDSETVLNDINKLKLKKIK